MQVASIKCMRRWMGAAVLAAAGACGLSAQTAAAPHQSGTVKAVSPTDMTVTTASGDYVVTVPAGTQILEVAPGSKDLKSATAAQLSDVSVGDKVIVTGSAGDTGTALTARRVILMKSAAIAETHAAEDAAWARGGGGIVKSADASTGTVVVSSGLKTLAVTVTPETVIRRYADGSVRAQDAVPSTVAAIHPGDQLRVRGTKSADGSSIVADAVLSGGFKNFSGLLSAIDTTAGTVTFKDLATKKVVTVAVTDNSDVRRLPPQIAAGMAMRMRGGAAAGASAGAAAGSAPATAPASDDSGRARAGRAGMDLSQMLQRLPKETVGGLKSGEAVMIVASAPADGSGKATAVTLLVGVDALLSAAPSGETMTLSPWSVGGAAPSDAGGGGSPQ